MMFIVIADRFSVVIKATCKKNFSPKCTIRLFKSIAKHQGEKQNGKYKRLIESYKMDV